jgi:uncharacterized membrane protein YgaE (UPF0421/DUF939 family)
MTRRDLMPALGLSLRAAAASTLALAAAQGLGLPFPIYAMISAVIVTDVAAAETRKLAPPRLIGTVIGVVLGAAASPFVPTSAWAIGLGVLVAMSVTQAAGLMSAAKLAGYVCAIVLIDHGDQAWNYGFYRFVETVLGIAAAVLVSFVPRLVKDDDERENEP